MTRPRTRLAFALGLGAYLSPLVFVAAEPVPDGGLPDLDAVVDACQTSGLEGWDLVEHARSLVAAQFVAYSALTPWETAAQAFARRAGYSAQYNGALVQVLRRLGMQADLVFAARIVDGRDRPWWRTAHVWAQVRLDGRLREVCVAYPGDDGSVDFTPATTVQPFSERTQANTKVVLTLTSAWQQWRSLVTGRPVPTWIRRPFDSR